MFKRIHAAVFGVVFGMLGLGLSAPALAHSESIENYSTSSANNREHQVDQALFHKAATKYVEVIEKSELKQGKWGLYWAELEDLLHQLQSVGYSEELEQSLLRFQNKVAAETATHIGIQVSQLSDFYDYFFAHKVKYISKDSFLYETLIENQ
ncbi:hypothetical protein [Alteromonas sp. a30]|uniref:hypothetical protein n=1 Tax=Alteromonas sp. a30 TaxID=2730917 RepID=UPI00227DC241|nr:hypothetical protein [Alteromonas sp. a30]MCY7297371.1 hypothetical protein [Alteromonas sp. a30]